MVRYRYRNRTVSLALLVVLLVLPPFAPVQQADAVSLSGITGVVSVEGGLNLRTSANWSAPIVKLLPNGTSLTILATSGDWFKVTALKKTGWVNSWYVTVNGTLSQVITRGNTKRKMVALTFDAGSDLGYTEKIITILEREGVPASFGLTGSWMEQYPDYAEWIAADGFQILNHTLRHYSYTGVSAGSSLSPASQIAQVVAAENEIAGIGGKAKPFWRPPYGDYNANVLRNVGAAGYRYTVMWSIDTLGWNGLSSSAIYSRVMNAVGNGTIILMHVGADSADALALQRIIDALQAKGYTFGTISQLIA